MPVGDHHLYDTMDPDQQEAVISGLEPDTTYQFTVAAYTRKGDGARSKPAKEAKTKGAGTLSHLHKLLVCLITHKYIRCLIPSLNQD
jgi:hypothetical protein